MRTSQIAELAASLAAGGITADAIEDEYGHSILSPVLGLGTGSIVAAAVPSIMRATGVSGLIDDLFDW